MQVPVHNRRGALRSVARYRLVVFGGIVEDEDRYVDLLASYSHLEVFHACSCGKTGMFSGSSCIPREPEVMTVLEGHCSVCG